MNVLQLKELIEMETPLGLGWAILVEVNAHEIFWTIALHENGALVTFTQDRIRMTRSYTHHREISDERMREIVKRKK